MRLLHRAVLIGLGVLAGAVLPAPVIAQVPVSRDTVAGRRDTIPVRRDTIRTRADSAATRKARPAGKDTILVPLPLHADSLIRNDSARQGLTGPPEKPPVDTIKPPLPRPASPPVIEIGAPRVYDRAAIFATGALTLSDLLGRVPGLTSFAPGALVAPIGVASQGNLRGVRVFLDGIELDPMDQREQGTSPVNDIPLHTLEELRIERGADEVRVYARTWRVEGTDPYTRADVLTGDQNTNLYRAFFGRRYTHGEALQVTAQQLSTQPLRSLPSSDALSFMIRTGLTHGPWSGDLTAVRSGLSRDVWVGQGDFSRMLDTIAPLNTKRTTTYLRIANGSPDAARWAQFVASANAFTGTPRSRAADSLIHHDSSTYETQYVLTGGLRRGPARLTAAERIRIGGGQTSAVPSVRGSFESGPLALTVLGEGASPLRPYRAEATGRVTLRNRVAFLGAASRTGSGTFDRVLGVGGAGPLIRSDGSFTDIPPGPLTFDSASAPRYELDASTSARAEAGLRINDLWLTVGLLRRGATTLLPPAGIESIYSRATAVRPVDAATARTISLRGHIAGPIGVDAWALAWSDSVGLYRPKYQSRSELYLQTSLLNRFPRGNFGLLTSLAHEYRSSATFAAGDSLRTAGGSRTLDFKIEIRIQTAVISYQFRNLLQERYAQVPGFLLPRQTQLYGVRWVFFN